MPLLPLSYAQRSLWLLHQFAPEGGAYNVNIPLRIRSTYNEPHLRACLERLLQRHEMLRARYIFDGRQLGYEIVPRVAWNIEHVGLPSSLSDDELVATVSRHSHKLFPLDRSPVFRVTLFSRGPEDHVFLFSTHHINGDLFSIAQFMEELFLLYASKDPTQEPLPHIEANFADHVREQQEFLDGPEGHKQWEYWSNRLVDPLPHIHFPLDRARPQVQGHRGAMIISRLPSDINLAFRAMAKAEKTTLFMALLSVFYASLYQMTSQTDLLVGTPVPGRRGENKFERVMGTFVNVLALRVQTSPSMSFRELIQQVSTAVREGREHQDFPFPLLVERLRVPRDTSRTPIFQTYFTLQRLHHRPDWLSFFLPTHTPLTLQIGDMTVGTLPLAQQEGQMEIAVHVYDVNNELFLEYKYNTDLFDQATVERMRQSYEAIIRRAIDETSWPLSVLSSS